MEAVTNLVTGGQASPAAPDSGDTGGASTAVSETEAPAAPAVNESGSGEGEGSVSIAEAVTKKPTEPVSGESGAEGKGEAVASESGVPDQYAAFVRPEGFEMSDERTSQFGDLMREGGLGQQMAQKVLDLVTAGEVGALKAMDARQKDAFVEYAKAQMEEAKKDPRLIGEGGGEWEASMATIQKVVERFTGKGHEAEGAIAALKEAGITANKDFMVLMRSVGGAMSADTLDPSGDPGASGSWEKKTLAEQLFGGMLPSGNS